MFDDHFVSFRHLAQIFWTVSWNCFLRAPRLVLTKKTFFRTKKCSLLNFGFRAKKFRIFVKKFCKNGTFWKRNNFVKKKETFVVFWIWAKNSGKLPKKLLALFPKLKMTYPGDQILSHFLMFDYPFCQFPTFSRGFLESLSKLLSSSAKDRFDRRKVLSNKEEFFQRVSDFQQKKLTFPANKISRNAKLLFN